MGERGGGRRRAEEGWERNERSPRYLWVCLGIPGPPGRQGPSLRRKLRFWTPSNQRADNNTKGDKRRLAQAAAQRYVPDAFPPRDWRHEGSPVPASFLAGIFDILPSPIVDHWPGAKCDPRPRKSHSSGPGKPGLVLAGRLNGEGSGKRASLDWIAALTTTVHRTKRFRWLARVSNGRLHSPADNVRCSQIQPHLAHFTK